MTIRKRHLAGTGLTMAMWFAMLHWVGPLISSFPLTLARLNVFLVLSTAAFLFYYHDKTTRTNDKQLLDRMLTYTAVGVVVVLATRALRGV